MALKNPRNSGLFIIHSKLAMILIIEYLAIRGAIERLKTQNWWLFLYR